jgi:hypothetical protein|tara:strand:- start:2240 stop:2404 length:165 start_codon:yes stop_codon:yes gene_type:complete
MTPTEALGILNQATGMIQANRATHEKIGEALQVLADIVQAAGDDREHLQVASDA